MSLKKYDGEVLSFLVASFKFLSHLGDYRALDKLVLKTMSNLNLFMKQSGFKEKILERYPGIIKDFEVMS